MFLVLEFKSKEMRDQSEIRVTKSENKKMLKIQKSVERGKTRKKTTEKATCGTRKQSTYDGGGLGRGTW